MLYHRIAVLISTLSLAALFLPGPAYAQEKPVQIKLGVLNIVRLTQTSLMSKDIARQIDSRRKLFRAEIKSEEQALRKANEDLQKQRVILSPAAFEQEIKLFRQKELALQRKVQQRNQEFNRLRVFTTRAFEKELNKALVAVTKKHNFTLVFRKREVLVTAAFLDITKLVLAQIDKNSPSFVIPDVLPKRVK
jgi:Skp family chaperone for outer membrane proteins